MADGGRRASLPRRDTGPFSMLGVTWTDASARVGGTVEVRTRSAESGTWSAWLRLDADSGRGENGAARGGTEPVWVGPSDGVEARLRAADGATSDRLPSGLRLDMIDPGSGRATAMEPAAFAVEETPAPADATEPTGGQTSATGPRAAEADPEEPGAEGATREPGPGVSAGPSGAPVPSAPPRGTPVPSASGSPSPTAAVRVPPGPPSGVPRPPITSRAGWGADESISPEEPGYLPGGRIRAVVVHHTAESNAYTCEQAPAVVRGIYAYHVQQLGWKDIGYNFLVDKCGTVYEGRKGGVDRPVLGAHAYGFNSETTGISVLGAYTDAAPSQAAMASVAQVVAWKLGRYGVDPAGTATLTAGASGRSYAGRTWASGARLSFPAVHGHRDGYNTRCPGDALYDRLATIRSWAAGPVAGLASGPSRAQGWAVRPTTPGPASR
ncbi:N-acetylmuramoyl-L-alanine amidase [Streptomyces sp. C10-9-1]|uniref:N-acetylmuramoyl-L-alanine amidase n=1 Tax=Streptomyces sp. C10-9-1 TaxID=1859285 RepID=UPI00211197E5|nr:N-acetylmuramoyl-L-alanine amidase [Streptomyces sp. C10-9-1]MCQ6552427.1 N-acetylmuramoyl-L-alanine amidase [Streptomyces sp. C10-9-1]